MTEKRFIMVKCIYGQWCIVDKTLKDDQVILLAESKPCVKYIVDLLNELHEENQSLKFQLDECRNNKLFSRRQLEKENEQLKKEKEYFLKVIFAMGDYAEMVDYEKIIDASDAVKRRFLND